MLAGMTAGYHDYALDPLFVDAIYCESVRGDHRGRSAGLSLDTPVQFTPGRNWSYSHSDYVILGLALEKITSSR